MDLAGRTNHDIDAVTPAFEKEAQRLVIRLEIASGIEGTVENVAGGNLAYKLTDTQAFVQSLTHVVEGLGEAFIESIRCGPLEITLIAENRETARTVREFHREEVLLRQFNIALRKHGRKAAIEKVLLVEPANGKVDSSELSGLRKKAEEELSEISKNGIKREKNLSEGSVVETKATTETLEKTDKPNTKTMEMLDVEAIVGLLNKTKHEDCFKSEVRTEKQVLDTALFALVGHIQHYKLHMAECDFDQAGIVRGKALDLIQSEFASHSGEDFSTLAEQIGKKGEYFGAVLLHELSGMLYARQNSSNAAVGVIDCMLGTIESLKEISKAGSAAVKLIARDYALPVMLRLKEAVRSMDQIEEKERIEREAWCVYRLSECHELAGEFKFSLKALRESRHLVEKARGKEGATERRVYGAILNAIGFAHHRMAAQSKARKYYRLALEVAAKNVADFRSSEERSRHMKIYETNLSIVDK